jgi:hypothetical protein
MSDEYIEICVSTLRDEVKAWRDWNKKCGVPIDGSQTCSCEDINRVQALLNAISRTDKSSALFDELEAYRKFGDASIPMITWDAPDRGYWPFDDGSTSFIVSAIWSDDKDMCVTLAQSIDD